MIDVLCMEAWRSADEGDDGDSTSKEHTSTTNSSSDDKSNEVEVQQVLIDHQQFEHGALEAKNQASKMMVMMTPVLI